MSADRELLELAAKAAGFRFWDWLGGDGLLSVYDAEGRHSVWNPLTDDGDALRLAAAILMEVYTGKYEIEIHVGIVTIFQPTDGDTISATRRAIVRAAAEIGKAMP